MKTAILYAILLVLFGGLLYIVVGLPFGQPLRADMDEYFIRNSQPQTGANNVVTSVVFDFRGFDTLGEATVLFTAVLGVGMLFRQRHEGEEYAND